MGTGGGGGGATLENGGSRAAPLSSPRILRKNNQCVEAYIKGIVSNVKFETVFFK
jgi:hypothetical protein